MKVRELIEQLQYSLKHYGNKEVVIAEPYDEEEPSEKTLVNLSERTVGKIDNQPQDYIVIYQKEV